MTDPPPANSISLHSPAITCTSSITPHPPGQPGTSWGFGQATIALTYFSKLPFRTWGAVTVSPHPLSCSHSHQYPPPHSSKPSSATSPPRLLSLTSYPKLSSKLVECNFSDQFIQFAYLGSLGSICLSLTTMYPLPIWDHQVPFEYIGHFLLLDMLVRVSEGRHELR